MISKTRSKKNDKLFVEANAAWDKGDLRRAFELFLQAAKLGDRSSQLDLGYFFDCGLHVKKDKKKASTGITKHIAKATHVLPRTSPRFIEIVGALEE